jgi:acyloxyacyl hydrolase
MGRELWKLVEPIDGFHMNQDANALLADEIWSIIESKHDWLGNINPYNNEILKIFGDQGGSIQIKTRTVYYLFS